MSPIIIAVIAAVVLGGGTLLAIIAGTVLVFLARRRKDPAAGSGVVFSGVAAGRAAEQIGADTVQVIVDRYNAQKASERQEAALREIAQVIAAEIGEEEAEE